MKKNVISINGNIASGKTEVINILSKKLNYDVYSNGDYGRKLAKKMNINITELSEYLAKNPKMDLEIEESAKKYADNHNNFIIDARLGFFVVPESFKVYLSVDIDVASTRVFNDKKRGNVEKFESALLAKEDIIRRQNIENERYYKLYNVKVNDTSNYDLVIDTSYISINEVVNIILDNYNKWLEKK